MAVPALTVGEDGQLALPWLREPLRQALGQRAHALMLHGAAGTGTLHFGVALAQAWLCEADDRAAARPCGRCAACRLVQQHVHPDLRVLLPEQQRQEFAWPLIDDSLEEKKPSKWIRIKEVRAAIDWVSRTSGRGRGKVLLLHPAERLQGPAANALLKTLEEPPPGTRILLGVADPALLLPTLRSRCQRVALPAPDAAAGAEWLAGQGVADATVLLAAAAGRPLAAQALAEAGVDAAAWSALPRAVANGDAQALAGWTVPRAVEALLQLCHDAMAAAVGAPPRYFPASTWPRPAAQALAGLAAWQQALLRVARHDEHPWNEALVVESLVMQGRQALKLG